MIQKVPRCERVIDIILINAEDACLRKNRKLSIRYEESHGPNENRKADGSSVSSSVCWWRLLTQMLFTEEGNPKFSSAETA